LREQPVRDIPDRGPSDAPNAESDYNAILPAALAFLQRARAIADNLALAAALIFRPVLLPRRVLLEELTPFETVSVADPWFSSWFSKACSVSIRSLMFAACLRSFAEMFITFIHRECSLIRRNVKLAGT